MEGENQHISSSSAGNSFGSVKLFRRRCDPSSRSQVLWRTMHHHRHLIRHQTWCNRAIRPLQSSISLSCDSRSSKNKRFHHHVVSCP
jgi:hypothetical protein